MAFPAPSQGLTLPKIPMVPVSLRFIRYYYWYILTVAPGDTTGSYHRAVYSHIFIEYLILYGPVQRQRPSHGTTHTGAVFTRLGILLPQDPSITHSHPSIPLSLPLGCTASRNIITSLTRFPCFLGSLLLLLFPCYSLWSPL